MPSSQCPQHLPPHLPLPLPERRSRDIQDDPLPARNRKPPGTPSFHQPFHRVHRIPPPRPETLIVPRILAHGNANRNHPHRGPRPPPASASLAGSKYRLLIKHVVERQQHLRLHTDSFCTALQQHRNIPDGPYPRLLAFHRQAPHRTRIAGRPSPAVHAHTSSSACAARSTNAFFSSKSAGQYPHTASSGNITKSADSPPRPLRKVQDLPRVPYEVPDRRIDLRQRNLHSSQSTNNYQRRTAPTTRSPRTPPQSSSPDIFRSSQKLQFSTYAVSSEI